MCSECDRLRARVRELEDELAEWRRGSGGIPNAELLADIQSSLGLRAARLARVLATMLRRPGQVVGFEEVYTTAAHAHPSDLETLPRKRAEVEICHLRAELRARSLPLPKTMRGMGYYFERADVRTIMAAIRPDPIA